jgi:hypothetical protein
MSIRRLILPVAMLLVVACANSHDAVIPTDPRLWDTDFRPTIERLPQGERSVLVAYLARVKQAAALSGQPIPAGVTVGQAIDEQRRFEQSQATSRATAVAAQLRLDQERRDLERRVAEVLSVTLVNKRIVPADLAAGSRAELGILSFELQNRTVQPIVHLAGTIRLSDGFAGDLASVRVDGVGPIAPGATLQWESSVTLDLQSNAGQRLRNSEPSRLTATFSPDVVELTDGTRLVAPTG